MKVQTRQFDLVQTDSAISHVSVDPSGFVFVDIGPGKRQHSACFEQLNFSHDLLAHTTTIGSSQSHEPWQLTLSDQDAGYLLRLMGDVDSQLATLLP
ncbi:hypothetical protein [uncultured Ferrimonas sp.]|uniref:hypothetical protein n=1 Tax=uncultured Ferrimonas sp. TaxID=432640 RepID=UPI0026089D73|nr:hypothetical protein [uncultured Ferrimonas sp.]